MREMVSSDVLPESLKPILQIGLQPEEESGVGGGGGEDAFETARGVLALVRFMYSLDLRSALDGHTHVLLHVLLHRQLSMARGAFGNT